jgi:high-affinity iron transporter
MNWSTAIPTFLITLREGVEAALVVGIVLACLRQAQALYLVRFVYAGILAGLGVSAFAGVALFQVLSQVQDSDAPTVMLIRQVLETGLGLIAIAMLSWMLVWMTRQARSLKAEIEGSVRSAMSDVRAGWSIFSLIATAVLREGIETVLFLAAQFQQSWTPVIGAIAGILAAVAIASLLFRWGVKINLKQFFQVMGVLLLLIVSGLVISVFRHLDAAAAIFVQLHPDASSLCWSSSASCLLGGLVWDTQAILPDRQFPGIILKTLFGYTQTLYLVPAIAYLLFLTGLGGLYFRSLASGSAPAPNAGLK